MVSRTPWFKVIPFLVGVAILLGLLLLITGRQPLNFSEYSASDAQLDLAVVDGIAKANKSTASLPKGTRAIIVPHHLVAAEAIALGVKSLAAISPKVVVIISPDHFHLCPTLLCTTSGSYKTFFGQVSIAQAEVNRLLRQKSIVSDSNLFTREHGVYSIVPFISHYLKDATIVPIAVSVKEISSPAARAQFISLLKGLTDNKDTGIIVSSDFSHYLPLKESNQLDEKTALTFCNGKPDEILQLDNPAQSDCPICLWALEEIAKLQGFWNPIELWHSNSASLLKNSSVKETTSHFTFALTRDRLPGSCSISVPKTESKILFVGDVFFDRSIRQVIERKGGDFIFSCIDNLLSRADRVVGNLEGPITDLPSVSVDTEITDRENFIFTFPIGTASLLRRHNLTVVNLGNNHINNFGEKGISSTRKYLEEAGVAYFGGIGGNEPIHREKIGNTSISFVSYNQFGGMNPRLVAEQIREEKRKGNLVIVYAHWGNEYSQFHAAQKELALLFAENGADAIIGSHPHVVLTSETMGQTRVYYSLGNFIFDQYFDPEVTQGLAVMLNISNGKVRAVEEIPLELKKDGRVCRL